MKGLYRNELLKLIAQNSFKVILIIALALSLLAPGAILGLEGLFQVTVERWDDVEFYEEMKNSTTDKVEKAWYSASIDSRVYFVEHGYSNEDWIYAEYFDEYEEIARLICAYRLIEEGTPYEPGDELVRRGQRVHVEIQREALYHPRRVGAAVEGDEDGEWIENPDFAPPTKAQAKEYRLLLEGEKEAMEDKLMKVTIAEYFTDRASESREKKAAVEARLAALTEQLPGAKTPPEIQGINYEIEKAKLEAKCAEEVAQSYEEGAKQGYDYTDWHVSAGTAVRERIYQSLAGAVVMGPAVYEYEGHYDNTDNGGDYDGYKKRQQTAYEDAALALEMLDYSLENDLPVDGGTDDRLGGKRGCFPHGAVRVGDDALSHRRGGNERGAGAFGRHDPSFADPSEDEREDPPFQISRPAHLRRRAAACFLSCAGGDLHPAQSYGAARRQRGLSFRRDRAAACPPASVLADAAAFGGGVGADDRGAVFFGGDKAVGAVDPAADPCERCGRDGISCDGVSDPVLPEGGLFALHDPSLS